MFKRAIIVNVFTYNYLLKTALYFFGGKIGILGFSALKNGLRRSRV